MLDVVGPERVVFGTDYYSMMPDPQPSVVLDYFASHEVPIEIRAAVLGGNLQRILALGPDENPATGSLGE
jgi:predicted TIM-barrel fold metal-dependent hydrolase